MMIKATYICDKCGKEHEAEFKAGQFVNTEPRKNGSYMGWHVVSLKWDQYSSFSKLLCDECCAKVGYKNSTVTGENYEERQSNAEKLMDLMIEICEENGFVKE